MDTALTQKFPFILDGNLAKANCTEDRVCTSCDTVVLAWRAKKKVYHDRPPLPLSSFSSSLRHRAKPPQHSVPRHTPAKIGGTATGGPRGAPAGANYNGEAMCNEIFMHWQTKKPNNCIQIILY